mmetsp:Transcript_8335/g.16987  ORF Transcript_8335/g.16987 Transcript_8335/m.16987 type:complete len:309 (-) Transcript_8335:222-1148(-)|eukprot:CAMPEP_0184678232 /NCGR_PEP_ID=MMETSP0312-20130426/946_1 /TAXON_ID=31354 /ORGANISM="Compsopogon coeruleus, Strain SAG 36.94" /LENGTH=308 /DNA_ID=CAMNT_0027126801 /DNA_START=302 /DNA_END=1228 /DNA_ORIENTATION=+
MSSIFAKRRSHRRAKTDFEDVRGFAESLKLEDGTVADESQDQEEAENGLVSSDLLDGSDRRRDVESNALEMKQVSWRMEAEAVTYRRESRSGRMRLSIEENFSPLAPELAESKFARIIMLWREIRVEEDELDAQDFTAALESLMMVIEALGTAFQLINMDVRGKCKSINRACTKHSAVTLQRMMEAEQGKGQGSEAVLWMKRTLQFTDIMMSQFLRNGDLPAAANEAYKRTLHDCHPFVVRSVASNIRMVVPSGEVFCARLDGDVSKVKKGIREFLIALKVKIRPLIVYFNVNGLETVKPCKELPIPL